jgi:hypothetical protein
MRGKRNACKILVGKSEETTRHRLEDNIKMGPKGMGWGDVDWIHLAQDQWRALMNTVMNLHVP